MQMKHYYSVGSLATIILGCTFPVCWNSANALEGMVCEQRSLTMNYVQPSDQTTRCPVSGIINRSYTLCVPSKLKAEPELAPLVLAFHGAGESSSATAFQNRVQFEVSGLKNEFITAYPNGCRVEVINRQRVFNCNGGNWNAQGNPPRGISEICNVDDVAFVTQVINDIKTRYPINRIFAYGHSKGGIFAYTLACDRPDLFTAIGVTASTLTDVTCSPPNGVSIFHVHNLKDPSVPLEGGGIESTWPSAKEGLQFWATKNQCILPIDQHNFSEDMCLEASCQTALSVEFCRLDAVGGDLNIDPQIPHRYDTYDAAFMAGNKKHKNIRDAFVEKFLE